MGTATVPARAEHPRAACTRRHSTRPPTARAPRTTQDAHRGSRPCAPRIAEAPGRSSDTCSRRAAVRSRSFAGICLARVPSGAAVVIVGFDDERAALLVDPPLTTVRQPHEEVGAAAVDMPLRAIGGEALGDAREELPTRVRVLRVLRAARGWR
ncbi:substrate-binding domain-containing protein [Microbacterium sp. NPDC090003]|uniref:substrate-binding domain-containing protein n=1 Tax=Microbacterium sp. NPDC090003 TaxID=3364203 RepID=UPI0037F44846